MCTVLCKDTCPSKAEEYSEQQFSGHSLEFPMQMILHSLLKKRNPSERLSIFFLWSLTNCQIDA